MLTSDVWWFGASVGGLNIQGSPSGHPWGCGLATVMVRKNPDVLLLALLLTMLRAINHRPPLSTIRVHVCVNPWPCNIASTYLHTLRRYAPSLMEMLFSHSLEDSCWLRRRRDHAAPVTCVRWRLA